ncbi:MAG: ABC transporter substrate-binding protein [Thermoleophilia bacterium]|nr:ABC transporter substrate-binding protein [Thermoleophilia bacterium]
MKHRYLVYLAVALALVAALIGAVGCGGDETTTTTVEPASTETTAPASTETTATGPSGEPVIIGAVVSATGPASPLGEPEKATLLMMEKQVNDAGGILGRPLKVIIEDDQSDPQNAVTAAQKLIQQDKVVAIVGPSISPSALAMKPITNQAKIPQLAMAAANAITDEPPIDWMWRTPPKDALAAAKALSYVSETLKLTKVAVLHDENAFGASGLAEIEKTAPDWGIEIVAKESYKTDETDLTAQLNKIKGANPEVLVVWGTNPGPAVAAKNMKQLGMDIPYVGSHGIANKTFIDLAGDAAEGVVFPAGKLLVPSSIVDPQQKAVVDQFAAAYEAVVGSPPPTFAGHAFDALGLLLSAIDTAQSTDAAAIQTALNETTGFTGPDGVYNYTPTNHDGLSIDDMIVVKIEGGSWVLAE